MTISLLQNMQTNMSSAEYTTYHEQSFLNVIEDHLEWLKKRPGMEIQAIEPIKAYKYTGDLYGLLLELGVDPKLWYVIMRMTGLSASEEMNKDVLTLYMPNPSDMDLLYQRHNNVVF